MSGRHYSTSTPLGQVRVRRNHRGDALDGTVSLIRVIRITVREGQIPALFWQTITTRVAGAVVGRHRRVRDVSSPWLRRFLADASEEIRP